MLSLCLQQRNEHMSHRSPNLTKILPKQRQSIPEPGSVFEFRLDLLLPILRSFQSIECPRRPVKKCGPTINAGILPPQAISFKVNIHDVNQYLYSSGVWPHTEPYTLHLVSLRSDILSSFLAGFKGAAVTDASREGIVWVKILLFRHNSPSNVEQFACGCTAGDLWRFARCP